MQIKLLTLNVWYIRLLHSLKFPLNVQITKIVQFFTILISNKANYAVLALVLAPVSYTHLTLPTICSV